MFNVIYVSRVGTNEKLKDLSVIFFGLLIHLLSHIILDPIYIRRVFEHALIVEVLPKTFHLPYMLNAPSRVLGQKR